eukprot:TRINITY_DN4009_c0_g1_i1.p1 TRINITY_DN4009_c0_g1~~TRINITY_DN4009_c0_g1_i1.p1  ORF type:complete len:219 (+),score=30.27 TRINITY_DN4009_c0_g1_i1:40-696(+)
MDPAILLHVIARNGEIVTLDQSLHVLSPFGLIAGERLNTPHGIASVIGVDDKRSLWVQLEGDSGATCCMNCYNWNDLQTRGISRYVYARDSAPSIPKRDFKPHYQTSPSQIRKEEEIKKQLESSLKNSHLKNQLDSTKKKCREYEKKLESEKIFGVLLKDFLKRWDEYNMCIVCFQNPKEMVTTPCGHLSLCRSCSKLRLNYCPMCRRNVDSIIKVYI